MQGVITLLDKLDGWIDEIPPLPTPQRFGNLAFRSWGKRLEEVRPRSRPCPSTDDSARQSGSHGCHRYRCCYAYLIIIVSWDPAAFI